jgi:hypothetical protein
MLKGVQPDVVSFVISGSLLITHSINLIGRLENFGQLTCLAPAESTLVIKSKELPTIAKTDCTGLKANF